MIGVSSNANLVAADLGRTAAIVGPKIAVTTRKFGSLLEAQVKANASGRPGPRIITGDYRRSITMHFVSFADVAIADVGTNAPQGRRLELGFVGADSLGRIYNQPPYPHFRPALALIGPRYVAALAAVVPS